MYDAGSNDDTALGQKNRFTVPHAVKPTLRKLEHVVLSHPHRDHVELLADVITGYAVANVWDSGAINPICGYRRFIEAIAHAPGIAYHSGAHDAGSHPLAFTKVVCALPAAVTVHHGSRLLEGVPIALGKDAAMMFLQDAARHGGNYNDNSLVTLLDLDGTKVLLMWDAEAGGFSYRLEVVGVEAKLVSESWCRVVDGSGQRHEITSTGSRRVAEGFV